jgi:hypothetical protein
MSAGKPRDRALIVVCGYCGHHLAVALERHALLTRRDLKMMEEQTGRRAFCVPIQGYLNPFLFVGESSGQRRGPRRLESGIGRTA